jgi:hypothetical protein
LGERVLGYAVSEQEELFVESRLQLLAHACSNSDNALVSLTMLSCIRGCRFDRRQTFQNVC